MSHHDRALAELHSLIEHDDLAVRRQRLIEWKKRWLSLIEIRRYLDDLERRAALYDIEKMSKEALVRELALAVTKAVDVQERPEQGGRVYIGQLLLLSRSPH